MSTNYENIQELNELGQYLQSMIMNMNEIRSTTEVLLGTMELTYGTIYFKEVFRVYGEKYEDVLTKKENKDRRMQWKQESAEIDQRNREVWKTKPEQNDFRVEIFISKSRLPYSGEMVLKMHSQGTGKGELIFNAPILGSVEVDLENRRIQMGAKLGYNYEEMNYLITIDWSRDLNNVLIIETPEYLVSYDVKMHMKEGRFSVERFNKNGKKILYRYDDIVNRKEQLKQDIQNIFEEEKNETDDKKKEEIRKKRRKSVTEVVELQGLKKMLEQVMKTVEMQEPIKREPEDARYNYLRRIINKQKVMSVEDK